MHRECDRHDAEHVHVDERPLAKDVKCAHNSMACLKRIMTNRQVKLQIDRALNVYQQIYFRSTRGMALIITAASRYKLSSTHLYWHWQKPRHSHQHNLHVRPYPCAKNRHVNKESFPSPNTVRCVSPKDLRSIVWNFAGLPGRCRCPGLGIRQGSAGYWDNSQQKNNIWAINRGEKETKAAIKGDKNGGSYW